MTRAEIRSFYLKAKENPCVDCGGRFPTECMDFDHRIGEKKLFNPNKSVTFELLVQELAKCDLVCANCHRIRTKKRGVSAETRKKMSEAQRRFAQTQAATTASRSERARKKRSGSLKEYHFHKRLREVPTSSESSSRDKQ